MQPRKAHLLERILFVAIACTLVFVGLCIYTCLVSIYESRWPPHARPSSRLRAEGWPTTTSCIYHARWTTSSQPVPVPGQPESFQSHTSFLLPSDLETFLLSSQDKHASGIVYFAAAAASAAVIEVEVEALYGSEEALRTETRSICLLRHGRGQYGIGVFATPGHQYSEEDDITLKFTVWLPVPRVHAGHPRSSQRDSPPRTFDQMSMNAPIEADAGITAAEKTQIDMPNRYMRGKFNVSSPSEPATAAPGGPIAAGVSGYINDNDDDELPMTTDA